jgi:hypothetical protein
MRTSVWWSVVGGLVLLGGCSEPPVSPVAQNPQEAVAPLQVDRADLARLRLRNLSALGRGFSGAARPVEKTGDEVALRKQVHRTGALPSTVQRSLRGVR